MIGHSCARRVLNLFAGVVALCALTFACASAAQPNVLFIYLDDFGWKDTGYMGSDFFETPNLDRLAAEGMVFTDAYSCAANCAPARACLLSGQYTPRHQIFNVGTGPRGNAKFRRLLHVPGVNTLSPGIRTWAQCVQDAGYVTASIGKWHLSPDPRPYGFNVNIGGTHSGSPPQGYYPPYVFSGSAVYILPNIYFVKSALRNVESQTPQSILSRFYIVEGQKILLTMAMFAICFAVIKPLHAVSFFAAYILIMIINLAGLVISSKN